MKKKKLMEFDVFEWLEGAYIEVVFVFLCGYLVYTYFYFLRQGKQMIDGRIFLPESFAGKKT